MFKTLLVLPQPSRFDKANDKVLAGPAADLVAECLPPGYDVMYARSFRLGLPYTHIVLTGQPSLDAFVKDKRLDLHRGYVWNSQLTKHVATYWPQDCVDIRDSEYSGADDEDAEAGSTSKDGGKTARANYRFWFKRDIHKLYNTPKPLQYDLNYLTNAQIAQILGQVKGRTLYFDLESHPDNYITCFSFAYDDSPIFTAAIHFRNQLMPDGLRAMAALARAFSRNKIVIHNAGFDLPFLAHFHHIPFGQDIEDTMLMNHRIWPEAEKSLAHAITLWLNEPYHKDTGGTWNPQTTAQLNNLLRYNGKDVATLRAVHRAQWDFVNSSGDTGLRDSIVQVNSSIFPYLYTSLHGFPVNGLKLAHYLNNRRKVMAFWARVIKIAVGYELNPGSTQQVADYLINRMHYDVLARTETGAPQVDESTLYRYLIKYSNPVIRFLLKYKRAAKVAGELGFQWISR